MRFSSSGRAPFTPFASDPRACRALRRALAARLRTVEAPAALRAWVPGCGAGEDAYAVAACVFEALGRRARATSVRVFATDDDGAALHAARSGVESPLTAIGSRAFGRCFRSDGSRWRAREFLRSACLFAEHHLDKDFGFSHLDAVVLGRGLFEPSPAVRRIALERLAAGLKPGAVAWLGPLAGEGNEWFAPLPGVQGLWLRRSKDRRRPSRGAPAPRESAAEDGRTAFQLRRELDGAQDRLRSLVGRHAEALGFMRDAHRLASSSNGALRAQNNRLLRANRAAETAKARLRATGAKYRRVFSRAVDAILIVDASGIIVDANAAAAKLYGYARGALGGLKAERLQAKRPEGSPFARHLRRDKTSFPIEEASCRFIADGRRLTMRLVRDATSRLKAEAALAFRRRREVEDSFLATLSHELRTPVTAIKGYLETLRRGPVEPARQRAFLKIVERNADRLGRLVEGLLTLAKRQGGPMPCAPAPVRLRPALEEAAAALRTEARRRRVSIRLKVPPRLEALADPSQLPHVFDNLLHNAIKHNRPGGWVRVGARLVGGAAEVRVEDGGPGIPPEDLERVFDRFYRCEGSRGVPGSGLGLSIVKEIVEAHRGSIRAESRPGRGAVFRVTLPRA